MATNVAHPVQDHVQNRLLRALRREDFSLLQPNLASASLTLKQVLHPAGEKIEQLYFVEHGLASVVTASPLPQVEIGFIGRDGLVGASPILLGVESSPFETFVQMGGDALCIRVEALRRAVKASPTLHALLLRYVQTLLVQTAETAFANVAFTIESRLARWLLMCRDCTIGDEVHITHEFLSVMLGVRRPGVTIATQVLEGNGLIKAGRGRITILDRVGLADVAEGAYGLAKAEYASLIG